jgi:hypothetical protein
MGTPSILVEDLDDPSKQQIYFKVFWSLGFDEKKRFIERRAS